MDNKVKDISFDIQSGNNIHHVQTYYNSHKNLMALIFDELGEDEFGECKGMGRCGTCAVKLLKPSGLVNDFHDNEENTLSKLDLLEPGIRLSCKVFITSALDQQLFQLNL
ncbi:2Fe-2S iron-sulfur cluster-binding protein [Mucilaginibacter jinjuensis]|uniref:2Fe-2S iron-sulfur cluster-binding protein n=1 Tax=Mucilaginibacter jinjuensis TaxID=1176721 RepID=A0ABY7T3D2_9SPHI|nr:2Fe-2S iron-sulfur cluster-binding protein [Mucilaginibacter jinjuensis]WCT10705.1 2Fe-2S iron-sulfur cluster-binding protein [Mucilaginibacter jinjuensis]